MTGLHGLEILGNALRYSLSLARAELPSQPVHWLRVVLAPVALPACWEHVANRSARVVGARIAQWNEVVKMHANIFKQAELRQRHAAIRTFPLPIIQSRKRLRVRECVRKLFFASSTPKFCCPRASLMFSTPFARSCANNLQILGSITAALCDYAVGVVVLVTAVIFAPFFTVFSVVTAQARKNLIVMFIFPSTVSLTDPIAILGAVTRVVRSLTWSAQWSDAALEFGTLAEVFQRSRKPLLASCALFFGDRHIEHLAPRNANSHCGGGQNGTSAVLVGCTSLDHNKYCTRSYIKYASLERIVTKLPQTGI